MIPKECKRLAEVDFPISVVSTNSAREKSIRHGHPSTLHLWWARRPLAACRAMLMALLLPDPLDPNCPEEFKAYAKEVLPPVQGTGGSNDLRSELLRFIGDFSNWDNSGNATYLDAARCLVRAAHGEEPPLVFDAFAGGGSIPLEALRIGCDTFASDLNPLACLLLKTLLQDIPRSGSSLAGQLRRVGADIKNIVEGKLTKFYPADPDGAKPIVYLWARTIICDRCGAEVPLLRSLWLSKKPLHPRALCIGTPKGAKAIKISVFTPKSDSEVRNGTIQRGKATCLFCKTTISAERVRAQLSADRGGADPHFDEDGLRLCGARLFAVVTTDRANAQRKFRAPEQRDYLATDLARNLLQEIPAEAVSLVSSWMRALISLAVSHAVGRPLRLSVTSR